MKVLKNKFFISIVSCFLAFLTIFSLCSLTKAKAYQTEIADVYRSQDLSTYISFTVYDSYPTTISSYVDLAVGVDLEGSTIYYSYDSKHCTDIFFDNYFIRLNGFFERISIEFYKLIETSWSAIGTALVQSSAVSANYGCFSLLTSSFPENTNFKVTDIKHYISGEIEVDFVNYDILISPSSIHSFSDWVDEVPATTTTPGIKGHYTCSHCSKFFDENYVEITNLEIPKTSNSSSSGTGGLPITNGGSCSSASIFGIMGIAIGVSFIAFAISHIKKRYKKNKRK